MGTRTRIARSGALAQTGRVRKQYHLRRGESGIDAWDVDRLIELTRGLPVESVPLAAIRELDTPFWFDAEGDIPTVRRITAHMRLTLDVDPAHPIILAPDGGVMDGMHRVARALLDGREHIHAVRLAEMPEPDHRDCNPDELWCERG